MKRYILPPFYYEVPDKPVIFLAGPIHAAPRWQSEAARMILNKTKDIVVASPRRLYLEQLPADYFSDSLYTFYRQRPWEKYYMARAAQGGSILFWMPAPDPEYYRPGMVYGATTRFELGEWMTRYEMDPTIGLEIGAEPDFPTLHTIRYDKLDLMGSDEIYHNLETLVDKTIERAYGKFAQYRHTPDNVSEIKGLQIEIDI